ncbi:MAG TPA: hypothetical protein VJ810_23750 [Blastocatellia bacterium]|nr:hypothetical protein [Blastocatellia bacterium]
MKSQTSQSDRFRNHVAQVFGLELPDGSVENLAHTKPALYYLVNEQAQGRLSNARTATDEFLRRLPEDLFDYLLTRALSFFRRGCQMSVETLVSTEFCSVALGLVVAEQADVERERTDEECCVLMDRLARLLLLEEQRRVGAFTWVGCYSLLARVDDSFPPRLLVVDRRTEH